MKYVAVAKKTALVAMLALASVAGAQTPFAGEDFDGGVTNGGFTATTMAFTPDLASSTPIRSSFNGTDRFDRFGEVSRLDLSGAGPTVEGIPFGLADDSTTTFPTDRAGFVAATKTDDFVLSVDTTNGLNPGGAVSAVWTFNIAGRANIDLSMDFGMIGDYEEADSYLFTYSIDGGPSAPAFSISGKSGVFYSYTMDNGTFIDRFTNNFFTTSEWQDLIDNGPTPGVFEYHVRDTGLNGDTTANDGFIPVTFANGVEQVRGYRETNANGTFDNDEFAPVKDPLVITTGDGTLTESPLVADFVNFKTRLTGSGSVLTLSLAGVTDGNDEFFTFDNILLSEGASAGLPGDANADGKVDLLDLDILGANFGATSGATVATGDFNSDAAVDLLDLDILGANFGAMLTPAVAIPEPATLGAALAALAVVGARRRG